MLFGLIMGSSLHLETMVATEMATSVKGAESCQRGQPIPIALFIG